MEYVNIVNTVFKFAYINCHMMFKRGKNFARK